MTVHLFVWQQENYQMKYSVLNAVDYAQMLHHQSPTMLSF